MIAPVRAKRVETDLISQYQEFVLNIARSKISHLNLWEHKDDITQAALYALVYAAKLWSRKSKTQPAAFSTYMYRCVVGHISAQIKLLLWSKSYQEDNKTFLVKPIMVYPDTYDSSKVSGQGAIQTVEESGWEQLDLGNHFDINPELIDLRLILMRAKLKPRQKQMVKLMLDGNNDIEIAGQMGITRARVGQLFAEVVVILRRYCRVV